MQTVTVTAVRISAALVVYHPPPWYVILKVPCVLLFSDIESNINVISQRQPSWFFYLSFSGMVGMYIRSMQLAYSVIKQLLT